MIVNFIKKLINTIQICQKRIKNKKKRKMNLFQSKREKILDNKFELLVCTSNNSYSPSYRKWKIYKYENDSLTFIDEIYDGKITYNKSTNKI